MNNKWRGFLCLLLFTVCCQSLFSQDQSISGYIVDSQTKETLVGVPVIISELSGKGTATNDNGFYSLNVPYGDYTLKINYLGYTEQTAAVSVKGKSVKKDFFLESSSINLNEVVVSTERPDRNVSSPQTGISRLNAEEIARLPVLMGERDVIKSLQLMPGVKAASEGGAGFFVRGGTADQNLILLDGVSLYNASHLMGFFSNFNTDIVREATLYKGSMPAQYGERLASVLDVNQRSGDVNNYRVSGGIGLIASRLNVEGPIQKGKSSFIIGARRTYADAVARLSGIEEVQGAYLYFYDLNAKLSFAISDKDNLSFSGYWGRDKLAAENLASTTWGNLVGALRWSRIMNNEWNFTTSFTANRYSYDAEMDLDVMKADAVSDILDYGFKQEFSYKPSVNSIWLFGFNTLYHQLNPGEASIDGLKMKLILKYGSENAIYASNEWKVNDRIELLYGLRLSMFAALGDGDYYILDQDRSVTDTIHYQSKTDIVKTYWNFEPRASFSFKLDEVSSVKAAYARSTQSMHLLSYLVSGTPYDRWAMSSNNIKPQIGDQYSIGYFRNFNDNMYEFSIETYYKYMQNILDFKDNASFSTVDAIETELREGVARAYGLELMLKKPKGRLTGWIGYTLAKSEKRIDGINNNEWYNAFQDRTHDISIVAMYDLTSKWSLSAAWVYYTGNAVTYPSGKYQIGENIYPYYAERNGYRAPAYHRLDLGATYLIRKTKRYTSELAFSLYNAYGRENPYVVNFQADDNDPTKSTAYQISLFRFIPSITWNFKF